MTAEWIAHALPELAGAEEGRDLWIVGTGTSLEAVDLDRLRGRRVLALNHAVQYFAGREPPAYSVFTDPRLGVGVNDWPIGPGTKAVTWPKFVRAIFAAPPPYAERLYLANTGPRPWCLSPGTWSPKRGVISNRIGSVLFAALEVALCLGASRAFLLGIDGYYFDARYYAHTTMPNPAFANPKYVTVREPIVRLDDGRITDRRFAVVDGTYKRLLGVVRAGGFWRGPFPASGVYNLSPLSVFTAFEKVPCEEAFGAHGN